MSEINWRGVDLNLLLTFDAIMTFGSVSLAAKHLYLGQPATSYNLKRLRTLFNDELFERHGNKFGVSFDWKPSRCKRRWSCTRNDTNEK